MNESPVIEARDLCKSYESTVALRDLNLQVSSGSIHALLGKNGAGKTTLIKILLDMTRPDAGHAQIFGLHANQAANSLQIRGKLGFVSETKDLMQDMTVTEMLRFTAAFYPAWDAQLAEHYRNLFELPAHRRVKELSQGMRSKLALLLTLSHHAELLVLDEPTSGLDPAATEQVLQAIISHVASENTTVLFSSHQIAEVEQIADHVTIIHRGSTATSGDLDSLRERYCRVQLVFADQAPELKPDSPGIKRIERDERVLTVTCCLGPERLLSEVTAYCPASTRVLPMSLKDIFFEEVGAHD